MENIPSSLPSLFKSTAFAEAKFIVPKLSINLTDPSLPSSIT